MRDTVLRSLIRAYPRAFRRAYGREMVQLFEHQRREERYRGALGAARFWADVAVDVAEGACRQWLAATARTRPAPAATPGTGRDVMTVHCSSEKNTMDSLIQDVRYALRTLGKSPGWTLAAAATLALGLGSTTAIFSVVNDVVLRPLPYDDADRIQVVKGKNAQHGRVYSHTSYPSWEIYRDAQTSFESLEAWANLTMTFNFDGGAESLRGAIGTAGLFPTLGVSPILGRGFVAEDDRPGSDAVVVLSHQLWQQRFGGDPGVLDSTFYLEEEPYIIVGVMPADFRFPDGRVQYWLPMRIAPRTETSFYLRMLGRVKQGLSLEQAQARLAALRLDVPTGAGPHVHAVAEDDSSHATTAAPGHSERITTEVVMKSLHEETVGDVRPLLLIFLAAVASVLLIASLNVANLMLSRAVGREREVALRTALGARRLRIVRQLVSEGLLLAALAGALGIVLADGFVRALLLLSSSSIPRPEELGLDLATLLFALGLMVTVGVAVALVPAWRASSPDLCCSLQQGARGLAGGAGHNRLRHGMIVAQLALTLVLLVGASLLVKSFAGLLAWESGFESKNLLVVKLELPGERYAAFDRRHAFYRELESRLESLPGVRTAAVASSHPFELNSWEHIVPEGYVFGKDERLVTTSSYVGPDFFDALGMTLVAGRVFDPRDSDKAVIVNQSVAARFFPEGDAVGRRMRVGSRTPHWREIVGVVADLRQYSLGQQPRFVTYVPYSTGGYRDASTMLIRTVLDPRQVAPAVRRAVAEVDHNVPVYSLTTLEDDLWTSLAVPRFRTILLATFGGAALLLSMVGLYGVMAYWVAQRTRELGVRMALGADGGQILRQVVGRGLGLAFLGLVLGAQVAPLAVRVLESYLFELEAYDPMSFAVAVLGLISAAFLACFIPAWRASQLDPISALRSE